MASWQPPRTLDLVRKTVRTRYARFAALAAVALAAVACSSGPLGSIGAMLSRNIQDTSFTTIDTNTGGNASIVYDCDKAMSGGGAVPQTYTVKAGTYKEISD